MLPFFFDGIFVFRGNIVCFLVSEVVIHSVSPNHTKVLLKYLKLMVTKISEFTGK